MFSTKICMALFLVAVMIIQQTEAASQHCTWHGTAPVCMPSCPSDKRSVMETACGKNKLACCITGKKKLCCPKSMGNIDPNLAAAMAH
ncbi:hypothetical protein BV898_12865 [Hypsibius exemplaris]|uniref:Uncharacterized protein n=1 Tax=Hypsibius exemplaris TaxID=2072580 RepID=A0A1W0WCA9_HYPEX|nr:hypothetical protein BV898_12865 [Hypsibius exemplaris]